MSVRKAAAVGSAAGGAVIGGVFAAQVVAAAAIPTLMSTGATVITGVGSTMPIWIGPVQAFASAGTLSVAAAPAVAVAGVAGASYAVYKLRSRM